MKLLGFCAGRPHGNSEIMAKEALLAAEAKGVEIELIRLTDCDLHNCRDCSPTFCPAGRDPLKCPYGKDDSVWLMEKFLDSDGYIIAAPAFSLTPSSLLFTFRDRVFGPKMDAAMVLLGERPEPDWVKGRFKARPGGLIGVGGALTEHWTSLNMPCLFTTTFSAQTDVVDTVNAYAVGDPDDAVAHPEWLVKARKLGENVADAMLTGDHRWRGEEPGSCPCCHQNMIQVIPGTDDVICPICGIFGKISVTDGVVGFDWPDDWEHRKDNRLTLQGKKTHQLEIAEHLEMWKAFGDSIHIKAKEDYHSKTYFVTTPPSRQKKNG